MKLEPAQAKTEAGIMASDERNANEKEKCRISIKRESCRYLLKV